MKSSKLNKRIGTGIIGAVALASAGAWSQATLADPPRRPMIEVGAGYEYEIIEQRVPHTNDPGAATSATDSSRSGARLAVTFHGIPLDVAVNGGHSGRIGLTFLPLYVVLDPQHADAGGGFGRVQDMLGNSHSFRRFVGTLLEGTYDPAHGIVSFRAKLGRVEFDRDRGTWDVRALDAEAVLKKAWVSDDGQNRFDIEVSVGVNGGGVAMNGLAEVERQLNMPTTQGHAFTIDPHAGLKLGYQASNFKVELVTSAEQRFDLTGQASHPTYLGNPLSVNSTHIVSTLDVSYRILNDGTIGRDLSIFASAGYEYDNLTLSNVFFDTNDAFHSFQFMGGLRGHF